MSGTDAPTTESRRVLDALQWPTEGQDRAMMFTVGVDIEQWDPAASATASIATCRGPR